MQAILTIVKGVAKVWVANGTWSGRGVPVFYLSLTFSLVKRIFLRL